MQDNEAFDDTTPLENRGSRSLILDLRRLPLWDFDTAENFSRCLKDIISGFQFLEHYRITHRNISAGSFFILQDSPGSYRGFIANFDHAEFTSVAVENNDGIRPLAAGAVQFVAMQILKSLADKEAKEPIVFQPRHDQESFLWVGVYTLYMHIIKKSDAGDRIRITQEFHARFTGTTLSDIYDERENLVPRVPNITANKYSKALVAGIRQYEPALLRYFSMFMGSIAKQYYADFDVAPEEVGAKVPFMQFTSAKEKGIDLVEILAFIDAIDE